MSLIPTCYEKRQAWERLYDWDFSPFDEFSLAPAETGVTLVSLVETAGDGMLTVGAGTVSGMKVQALLSAGTPGVVYTITATILTVPHSYELSLDGLIRVVA